MLDFFGVYLCCYFWGVSEVEKGEREIGGVFRCHCCGFLMLGF